MNNAAPLTGLEKIFQNVVGLALAFAGIVLFVMIINAGFKWISSGGDPQKIGAARNTATYAIFGIVLLALSYLFLRLLSGFTGVNDILNFQIFQP